MGGLSFFKKSRRGIVNIDLLPSIDLDFLINHSLVKNKLSNYQELEDSQNFISEILSDNEESLDQILNNLDVGIWSLDTSNNQFLLISKGVEIITGFAKVDFQKKLTWDSLIHPDDFDQFQSYQHKVRMGEKNHQQYRIITRAGDVKWILDQTMPVLDSNGRVIRIDGIIADITNQKKFEKQIEYFAYHDQLTGLPNRITFENKIEGLIKTDDTQTGFSIMYLDIDRFRTINQTLGHAIGDSLLQSFCKRVSSVLPKHSLFSKMGGDEFGLILWGYEQSDYPISIAKMIIDSLQEPFVIDDYELYVTCSIGIATYPINGVSIPDLIKNASAALYRAKAMGKNTYQIYSSALNIDTYKQFDLERDLRKSIENRELVIYFQPRVNTKTGRILSAEALVRWEHPVWGLVSPNEFIPLAEETGYINEISDWVMMEVCQSLHKWENEKLPAVPISINISAQRFLKSSWKTVFVSAIQKYDVDPTLLELEITETTIIKHEKAVENAFEFLKSLGIKIALDDFGTGYSSLSYIKNYSIDTIKIDQSFTTQITKSPNVEIIIKSLIFMAKGLGMNVVAEGVETIEQLQFLKQQECQEIQGYIFSKPVPKEAFQGLLKKGTIKPKFNSQKTSMKDRRKYYRIPLLFPLESQMTLTSIKGKQVELGNTEVLIEDIGPGGLKFLSNMHLPIRPDVCFRFETMIMGQNEEVDGHIVWKEEVNGIFQYGLQFEVDEKKRDFLIKKLNHFTLQLRDNPHLQGCKFVKEDRYIYLKKLLQSNRLVNS
ncbi:EAL domain-containing protein [Ferdinandcohnia sp. Marseille-Q9671]